MMLGTYEAVFDDGVVKLKDCPAGVKHARLLVTFLPDSPTDSDKKTVGVLKALGQLRDILADVPPTVSLAEELVAERRKEAARE